MKFHGVSSKKIENGPNFLRIFPYLHNSKTKWSKIFGSKKFLPDRTLALKYHYRTGIWLRNKVVWQQWTSMEDNLWWKTNFNGRQALMEGNLRLSLIGSHDILSLFPWGSQKRVPLLPTFSWESEISPLRGLNQFIFY